MRSAGMKWPEMKWAERISILLIYSTAVICCNLALIFWYSIANGLSQQFKSVDKFIVDLLSYFILYGLLAVIFFITFLVIKKIK
ncbi:MAG: hypothetical protein ACM34K_12775 [Bacillota bacterium]